MDATQLTDEQADSIRGIALTMKSNAPTALLTEPREGVFMLFADTDDDFERAIDMLENLGFSVNARCLVEVA